MMGRLRKLGFEEFATLDRECYPEAEAFANGTGPYIRTFPGGAIVIDKTGIHAEAWDKDGNVYDEAHIINLYAARAWVLLTSSIRHWQPSFTAVASFPGSERPGEGHKLTTAGSI